MDQRQTLRGRCQHDAPMPMQAYQDLACIGNETNRQYLTVTAPSHTELHQYLGLP